MPLLNSGRLRHQVQANEAARDAALAQYRKSILQALAEVESALLRIAENQARETSLQNALAHSRRQLQGQTSQWRHGETARFGVLEAQRRLREQEDGLVQAQTQSWLGVLALYKALGGGWE
ncbi:TolC family protein [Massilia sp. W12]|uniref:TolC family protein n=1 Tax=Massilia sp. W12 TaxID=3126507 RepID=UPI0030D017BF